MRRTRILLLLGWLRILLLLGLLLVLARPAAAQLVPLTNCDAAHPGQYTQACIGSTVCFNVTSTSGIAIPVNTYRKYLLIQPASTLVALYAAIGNSTSSAPLVAVINQNTIQIGPVSPIPANYEPINGLSSGNSPGGRVPTGAIALITAGPTMVTCIVENNG